MAGFFYLGGGGWTSCGWAQTPPNDGVKLQWGANRVDVRVWKWIGPHGLLRTPLMVATNDETLLAVLAGALQRELGPDAQEPPAESTRGS
jgi:hypothetical protein